MSQNDSLLIECLDLLEEYRDTATIQLAEYQQKLTRRYNQDVRVREFNAGDLVLRKAVGSMRDTKTRETSPNLGRTVQNYSHCRCRGVLSGRHE